MIRRAIVVGVDPAAAFRTWTERIALWWPRGHRVSGNPDGQMALEAGQGGRFFERASDGREHEYGRVLEWSPPDRLVLAFFLGGGPQHPTRVELTFEPVAGGTRVALEHTAGELPKDRFEGAAGRFETGWLHATESFAGHIQEAFATGGGDES